MSHKGIRALARDVFLHDFKDFNTLLGGLVLTTGVTNANFYAFVEIIIDISPPGTFVLQDENGNIVPQDAQSLLPMRYFILSDGDIRETTEHPIPRFISLHTGTPRVRAFTDQVRARDGRCVVTKEENLNKEFGIWAGFQAAHIFPLGLQSQWQAQGWSQQITILPPKRSYGSIDSVQNGLLLRSDIHELFDSYHFSINPDDGYKIVCFQRDNKGIAGSSLDARLLSDPRRPLATLLQWHFRQAVLTNMKGAGEPHFEHDFPPGSDIMSDIRSGPRAPERMEFELFGRLAPYIDSYPEADEEDKDEEDKDEEDKDEEDERSGLFNHSTPHSFMTGTAAG